MEKSSAISLLNSAQQQAVQTESGFVRIIAGAGSGKTRVLTERIAYLLEQDLCQPYEILAITFTNKAAKEMKERITKIVGAQADNMWVMTYHAFCARILRYHIHTLGYDRNFIILDTADQRAILREIYQRYGLKATELSIPMVLSTISNYKMNQVSVAKADELAFTTESKQIVKLYDDYERYLVAQKVLDFDDLLLKTLKLFEEFPEVLAQYAKRFKYLHVDEFQDTNDVQFRLVESLATVNKNLYIVGDPDQSIYGWRGAIGRLIEDFDQKYPTTETIILEQNYRSTQTILDAANQLIQNNTNRLKKNLFSENKKSHAIEVYEATDEKNEADYVAIKIGSMVREFGKSILENTVILYRANYLSRAIEEGLIRHGIPYTIYGDTRFLDRKEIKDMLAYLHLLLNPNTDLAFRRVINEPKRNVGEKTLERMQLLAAQHEASLFEALSITINQAGKGKAKQQLGAFYQVISEGHESLQSMSLAESLDYIYEESGYKEMLTKDDLQIGRVDNIAELRQSLLEYEQQSDAENTAEILSLYLQEMALLSSVDKEQSPFSVSLMTVHAAKGLEFDNVFVIGLNDDIFPSKRAVEEGALEEERRLAYVAITRAKQHLYVSFANGFNMMSKEMKTPSPFLYESRLLTNRSKPMFEQSATFVQKPPKKSPEDMSYRERGEKDGFKTGDKVQHKKFGDGVVVDVDGNMVTVAFSAEFGIKSLMSNFLMKS